MKKKYSVHQYIAVIAHSLRSTFCDINLAMEMLLWYKISAVGNKPLAILSSRILCINHIKTNTFNFTNKNKNKASKEKENEWTYRDMTPCE